MSLFKPFSSPLALGSACAAGACVVALSFAGCQDTAGLGASGPCTPAQPSTAPATSTSPAGDFSKIQNFVVIYLENHSFDNLYGSFPGAEGLDGGAKAPKQIDEVTGKAYATLPAPIDTSSGSPDTRFPATLANAPFDIAKYAAPPALIPDLVHRWFQEPLQIHGGKMDLFASISDAKGLAMGYYQTNQLPLAQFAERFTVADKFFHGAFGGSFLNHQWLIAAQSPIFAGAPSTVTAAVDGDGGVLLDGFVLHDGCYVVNTAYAAGGPAPATVPASNLVPAQTHDTIGDRLTAAGQSWVWYSGGWDAALAGNADPKFQYHHQPFAYFKKYQVGTQPQKDHLKDEKVFLSDALAGTLPAVSFVKPIGALNEHPGYADVIAGEKHTLDLIEAVQQGPQWKQTAIIITYDENGGFWDHVPPPTTDKWGPGARVPTIIVSPYARRSFVDHTTYDTTSILSTIEHRWNLQPLSSRDAAATDLIASFDFTQTP